MPLAKSVRRKSNRSAKSTREGDKYFSRAVAKALEILEFLQTVNMTASLKDIATHLGLSKTSAFRLLRTLEATNCLKLMEGGQYQIAPGIHTVAPTQWMGKLISVAVPHLEALGRELSETI